MIKADVRVNGGETSEYPKLMVSDDGMIVLFTESEVGVCLRDPDGASEGDYIKCWYMPAFRDFDGSITLSNEG